MNSENKQMKDFYGYRKRDGEPSLFLYPVLSGESVKGIPDSKAQPGSRKSSARTKF